MNDEMEAADPAYPDPDADPWSSPGYVPGTAWGLPAVTGEAIGERAWQRNARPPGLRWKAEPSRAPLPSRGVARPPAGTWRRTAPRRAER